MSVLSAAVALTDLQCFVLCLMLAVVAVAPPVAAFVVCQFLKYNQAVSSRYLVQTS